MKRTVNSFSLAFESVPGVQNPCHHAESWQKMKNKYGKLSNKRIKIKGETDHLRKTI